LACDTAGNTSRAATTPQIVRLIMNILVAPAGAHHG
jgi:hypothetical protein